MARKARLPVKVLVDIGTPELSKRHKLKPERSPTGARVRNLDGTELDRLLHRELISPDEYSIFDDFRADLFRANMIGVKARPMTSIMGVYTTSPDITTREAEALNTVHRAMAAMNKACSTAMAAHVVDMIIVDRPMPAKLLPALRKACKALARSYR